MASLILALALCAAPASAASPFSAEGASQSVYRAQEVTLRLVMADNGTRGALLIDLAPGWKTYWIDPGEAGLPPMIDFAKTRGFRSAALAFPAPRRFGEGFGRSIGYIEPMAITFELERNGAHASSPVTASVRLGVCEDICIPVVAELTAAPDAAAGTAVDAAFAALPAADASVGRIVLARLDDAAGELIVEAELQGAAGEDGDLFVTGPDGWYFDEPSMVERNGSRLTFRVPIAERPANASGPPPAVDLVLVSGKTAFRASGIAVAP